MKKVLLLFLFIIPFHLQAQDISGNWTWVTGEGESTFTISLAKISKNNYHGTHCSLHYGGIQNDCEPNNENFTIVLIRTSENIFQGSIKSAFSQTTGNILLQLLPKDNTLLFKITQLPDGIFFIPQEAILEHF